jgi:hypothetical protein
MINELQESTIHCPYCDERITVLLDTSIPEQQYVEDCQVCCRPMSLQVYVDLDGTAVVRAGQENE